MKHKTIIDLKNKLVNAVAEIDTSKITLCDLKLLADTVNVIAGINEKPFDFVDAYSKISSIGGGTHYTVLSDLKEE